MELPTDDQLVTFVRASNHYEGVAATLGDPYFDQHLAAAKLVRDSETLVHPHTIHSHLMGGLLPDAGMLRTGKMVMIDRMSGEEVVQMPHPAWLEVLVEKHLALLERGWAEVCSWPHEEQENFAFNLHAYGLCIHPYSDGNGRTFRLVWNQLRQRFGLPWATVIDDKTPLSLVREVAAQRLVAPEFYLASIESYEHACFKKQYPDVYQAPT